MEKQFDLIVIGAGPGGYVAALQAARLGLKTAVVEKSLVGGTCLNRGCIPAKSLIHATELLRAMEECGQFGLYAENIGYDIEKIYAYKDEVSNQLRAGVEQLLKASKIEILRGTGTIEQDGSVTVATEAQIITCHAKDVLIATGSKASLPPIPGIELPGIMTSDELLKMNDRIFQKLVIIGGGVIGAEFATVTKTLGSKVTILEAMPRILPTMDKEISQNLKMIFKKRGIHVFLNAAVKQVEKTKTGYLCHFSEKDVDQSIEADGILVSIGRSANTEGLFGENVQIEMERGRILVDENFRTSMAHIYAVGDVIKGIQLAHVASAQAVYMVEKLCKRIPEISLDVVPACVYTDPEIASVGITADEAKERGIEVVTGKFLTNANGKSLLQKEERGFIKVVFDKQTDCLLGAQMMCARATDMIGELATGIANQMTAKQLVKAMKAHPTLNESVAEAIHDCYGAALHVVQKRT